MSKKEKKQALPEQEEKTLSEQDTAETQSTPA